MLLPLFDALGAQSSVVFLSGAFVATQTWVILTLGETGRGLFHLQTVCLTNPSPSQTGIAARTVLSTWTAHDMWRFQQHFLLDTWIHPLVYALLLTSLVSYDLARRNHPNRLFYSALIGGVIAFGAFCDVAENMYHREFAFSPVLVAPDHLFFKACVFASTKWLILVCAVAGLLWKFLIAMPSKTDRRKSMYMHVHTFDPSYPGPRSEDFANAPYLHSGHLVVQGEHIPWTYTTPDYTHAERTYTVSPYAHYSKLALPSFGKHWNIRHTNGIFR
jgi:hypothetical protein